MRKPPYFLHIRLVWWLMLTWFVEVLLYSHIILCDHLLSLTYGMNGCWLIVGLVRAVTPVGAFHTLVGMPYCSRCCPAQRILRTHRTSSPRIFSGTMCIAFELLVRAWIMVLSAIIPHATTAGKIVLVSTTVSSKCTAYSNGTQQKS